MSSMATHTLDPLLGAPAQSLIRRAPVTLPPHATIREAAQTMQAQRVSSILIVERDHLFGLITDRDLRNRVVAQGLDIERPIADIATLAPLHVAPQSPAFDALLLMARHNLHHVPVLDGQRVVGMLTATDLLEQHSNSPVHLAGEIYNQPDLAGLQRCAVRVKALQASLAAAHASAHSTGRIISAITDALTTRLLQLAEARLGPAPLPYAWVCAGSQGRHEQTAKSDQDNCLVLADAADEAAHGPYFEALAIEVNAGLDACGYVYCPGDMMARTPQWRQPRRRWAEYFRGWVQQPDPTALMLTSVFFDQRLVHGDTALVDGLRAEVLELTRGNTLFLAHLARNALSRRPPLSMFGRLAPPRSGAHRGAVDLKMQGIVPIVDLARVVALAAGDAAVSTQDRLVNAAAGRELSERSARDLREAFEFLAALRIRHQARQIIAGVEPDHHVVLDELSSFERSQLTDAFQVVDDAQGVLKQRFQAGAI